MNDTFEKRSVEQFNTWSSDYDAGIWRGYFISSAKRAISLFREFAGSRKDLKTLDIGCATGDLTLLLSRLQNIGRATGLDISPEMINLAKQKAIQTKSSADFQVGRANELKFPDASFDAIFCLNSFHHYPDQAEAVREIFRVLKPGGIFILLDPFTDNPLRQLWQIILKRIFDEGYVQYHSSSNLKKMLNVEGFENVGQHSFWYFALFSTAVKTK